MTKDDHKPATKKDLEAFATKNDLKAFATKKDLEAFATKKDLEAFATKKDLKAFATKNDLKAFATKKETNEGFQQILEYVKAEAEETRRHFDVCVEDAWHKLAGANKDERELVKDKLANHEERLTSLEDRAGLICV